MDPSNKKVGKLIRNAGVLVRGRPAREGDRNRAGVPVAIAPPTPAQIQTTKRPGPAEPPQKQPPSDAAHPTPHSELTPGGPGEAVVYLAHLVSHLRKERERRGMSLADLSAGSGLDRGMLCKLENGRIGNPTFLTLWKYARALDDQPAVIFLDACRAAAESG